MKAYTRGIPVLIAFSKNYSQIQKLSQIFDKPFNLLKNSRKQVFKNSSTDYYEKVITNKLANFDHSSRLYLYSGLKTTFKLEEYLKQLKNFNSRQLITKFRISDHNLEVELKFTKMNQYDNRQCLQWGKLWTTDGILLCGNENLTERENELIFNSVFEYIKKSKRFLAV